MNVKNYLPGKTPSLAAGSLLVALAAIPMAANADTVVNFADAANSGGAANLGTNSKVFGDLTATGSSTLSAANFGPEIGLGVCSSSNGGVCSRSAGQYGSGAWNGQYDELDTRGDPETITITETNALVQLTGTFTLGSLDSFETGYVAMGDNYVTFSHSTNNGGQVSLTTGGTDWTGATVAGGGNVWTITILGFDTADSLSSVVFGSGCGTITGCNDGGDDNDYLVASAVVRAVGGDVVVPIPAAAWLFGSALLGLAGVARRKTA